MPRKYWWSGQMATQVSIMSNFRAKITGYATPLSMSPTEVADAIALCDSFLAAYNLANQSKATMQAMTQWREDVFNGDADGSDAPNPPEFPTGDDITYKRGVIEQFIAVRDRLVTAKGYTDAIGEDLMIIGAEISNLIPDNVQPELKTKTSNGYYISLSGSMQGMDGLRVEYARKGGNFAPVAFLTNTPGGFSVTPAVPGEPESGHIRAVFIKKNQEFGNYSADYPVTVS